MYELYLAKRLREEMRLAAEAENLLERSVRLQACRYYRDQLSVAPESDGVTSAQSDAGDPEYPL
jgi:hypothetical protein